MSGIKAVTIGDLVSKRPNDPGQYGCRYQRYISWQEL